jgi:FAD/FMN-containing dehydrogenase
MPDWGSLQSAIAGAVVLPDSPAYAALETPFNARFRRRPEAVVLCACAEDVADVIAFVARHGSQHAVRSGGHCFAGHSSTSGVLTDVTPMDSVSTSDGVASIGAGARLGVVYDTLQDHELAIPAGTCPAVGIAGLTLGGGLGILGRKYGVTCDHLIGAQIVLADGRILDCDEHHDAELFWALRGAGAGNFGVVTSLRFRTVPAPDATNFHAAWPMSDASSVIAAWQGWAPAAPDDLAASLKVTSDGDVDHPGSVDVYGAFYGPETDAVDLLDDLIGRARTEPVTVSRSRMSFPATRHFWANLGVTEDETGPTAETLEPRFLFTKSEFFRQPLPSEAIAALVANFSNARVRGESRELDFMPWGGAYNRAASDATAFVHRQELFQLKHAAVVEPDATARAQERARQWVVRSWNAVHAWGSARVFQNFADPDLEEWPSAYYGTNFERLVRVKARYDPANAFSFRQSIPVR